jgi:hypothetical protein
MATLSKSAASLSFFGDDLDPDEITRLLGKQPKVGVRKGGTWLTASGAEKIARIGSWRLSVDRREPGDLNGQIVELLEGLNDDLTAWRDLSARFGGRIFCGLFLDNWNEGLTLPASTLALLADRGLKLDLDIYGAEREADAPL